LTGLPNRGRLEQVLRGALLACDPTERVAVLVCGVADVLAAQGLRGGDDLLRQVTDRLRDALGDDDTLAYAGRGQYVVVRPRVAPEESGQHVLERLHAAAVAAVAPAATSGAVPVQVRSYLADPARNVHDREPADVLANALAVVPRAG
jgi:GGDEF domain-containing protein